MTSPTCPGLSQDAFFLKAVGRLPQMLRETMQTHWDTLERAYDTGGESSLDWFSPGMSSAPGVSPCLFNLQLRLFPRLFARRHSRGTCAVGFVSAHCC